MYWLIFYNNFVKVDQQSVYCIILLYYSNCKYNSTFRTVHIIKINYLE